MTSDSSLPPIDAMGDRYQGLGGEKTKTRNTKDLEAYMQERIRHCEAIFRHFRGLLWEGDA